MSPLTTGVYRIKISEKDEYWQLHAHDSTSTVSYAAVDEADPVQLVNAVIELLIISDLYFAIISGT